MSNKDKYPRFPDGDVVIVAPTGHTWKLHSTILSQFCPTFLHLLQKSRGHIPKKRKTDRDAIPIPQWKFNMVVMDQKESLVDFRPVDLSIQQTFGIPQMLNGRGGLPEYLVNYDNLFRCFYNIDPDLDHGAGGDSFAYRSISLIEVAERIDALGPVRRAIESFLLSLGQELWQRVIQWPHVFADLAIRLESSAIFKEAMVHVIGTWRFPSGMANMDSDGRNAPEHAGIIKEIAAKKVAELDELKKKVEERLIRHVPPSVGKKIVNGKTPSRADYSDDIYLWQAFTLLRQHITLALFNKQGRDAEDGGAAFYLQLNRGGSAYLKPKAVETFFEDFPMTARGEVKFNKALSTLKKEYQDITAELMVNNGQPFSTNAPPLKYLTLAVITDEDCPWFSDRPGALWLPPKVTSRDRSTASTAATSHLPNTPNGSPATTTSGGASASNRAPLPNTLNRSVATATTFGESSASRGTSFPNTPNRSAAATTSGEGSAPLPNTPNQVPAASTSGRGPSSSRAPLPANPNRSMATTTSGVDSASRRAPLSNTPNRSIAATTSRKGSSSNRAPLPNTLNRSGPAATTSRADSAFRHTPLPVTQRQLSAQTFQGGSSSGSKLKRVDTASSTSSAESSSESDDTVSADDEDDDEDDEEDDNGGEE